MKKLQLRFLMFTGIITIAITVLWVVYVNGTDITLRSATNTPLTPEPTRLYDPSQYGIPDVLGGYEVLAILTARDVACMSSDTKRIILQAMALNVHAFLQQPKSPKEILQSLKQLPGEEKTRWQLEFAGPGASLEGISSTLEVWNQTFSHKPCRPLGGQDLSFTTTTP
jgi:hypothetical protein